MSLLSLAKRAEIVSHLCEGAGIRPASRLTDTSPTTIFALLLKVGTGCDRLHDKLVHFDIRDIRADEIWIFIPEEADAREAGQQPHVRRRVHLPRPHAHAEARHLVPRRQAQRASTQALTRDIRAHLVTVPEVSTDGFAPVAAMGIPRSGELQTGGEQPWFFTAPGA